MYRFGYRFGFRDSCRVERGSPPCHVQRQSGEIHDTPVPAEATQVMCGTHKDAINRTRFDAQSTKHALRIVDGETGYAKPLTISDALLADIDTIDRTHLGTLIACDTGGQVIAMKTAITSSYGNRFFGILEPLGEGPATGAIGDQPIPQRDPQSAGYRRYRHPDISQPIQHRICFLHTHASFFTHTRDRRQSDRWRRACLPCRPRIPTSYLEL